MIENLSKQVATGLAQVDAHLAAANLALEEDTLLLKDIGSHIGKIENDVAHIEEKLNQLQADLFEIAKTQREESLVTDLNTTSDTANARLATRPCHSRCSSRAPPRSSLLALSTHLMLSLSSRRPTGRANLRPSMNSSATQPPPTRSTSTSTISHHSPTRKAGATG